MPADRIHARVQGARVEHLFAQLPITLANALFVTLIATILFWRHTNTPYFLIWCDLSATLIVARYLLYRHYRRRYRPGGEVRHWTQVYGGLALLHGLLWSALALGAYYYGGTALLGYALIILAGMTAGAASSSAAMLPVFWAFALAALGPVSFYLVLWPAADSVWLGLLAAGFLAGMLRLASHHSRAFGAALQARFENEALSAQLAGEKQQLAEEKGRTEQLAAQLYELSARDGLTGLANRRAFDEALAQHLTTPDQTTSLILCDVDAFKAYNDHYGHPQGDRCLKTVAATLAEVVTRPGDLVARYGGEEFAIILPHTDQAGAQQVAERLRLAVQRLAFQHLASPAALIVSLSFGVASSSAAQPLDQVTLCARADAALYQAKAAGRNRVVCSDHALSYPAAN